DQSLLFGQIEIHRASSSRGSPASQELAARMRSDAVGVFFEATRAGEQASERACASAVGGTRRPNVESTALRLGFARAACRGLRLVSRPTARRRPHATPRGPRVRARRAAR